MLKCLGCELRWILFIGYLLANPALFAQQTIVSGNIIDAETAEPLSFVNIVFQNTDLGTVSEWDGSFLLETSETVNALVVTYVGYEEAVVPIQSGKTQSLQIRLISNALQLEEVTVNAKRQKYSKKNNPAVDLMRAVIANKKQNGLKSQDFYQYDQYEKVEMDLNNLTDKFINRKVFKPFSFIWDYLDTTDTNGRPFLPILLQETNATVYHRSSPNTTRTYVHATQMSQLDEVTDQTNLNESINILYSDVDLYENTVLLLDNQFISPLAPIAIDFYRFYIIDTVEIAGQGVINVSFIPKNKANFGFTGNLYISNDGQFQLMKAQMGIFGNLNLNFVRDLKIDQEFQAFDSSFVLKKNKIIIDYAFREDGIGLLGTKTVYYSKYSFAPPDQLSVFDGLEKVVMAADADKKGAAYWSENRLVPLQKSEENVYALVDTIAANPTFIKVRKYANILLSGYVHAGKIDLGHFANTVSYNDVEGTRVKLGAETSRKFSNKFLLQAIGVYGFGDQEFKYTTHAYYSFNDDYLSSPRHYVHLSYVKETGFPGVKEDVLADKNVFRAIQWGDLNKMILFHNFKMERVKETPSFAYGISFSHTKRRPYGDLIFEKSIQDETVLVDNIETAEFGINLRFAPNQQFALSGKDRIPIYNEYPILKLNYGLGINNFLGGQYDYHKISASIFKKFGLSIVGETNVEVSAGKTFGTVPYILMHIPSANQTYAYQFDAYNLMNFIEFAGDQYLDVNLHHYFKGFFFNRIPLLKKLKLREVLTAKMVWGSLSDANNPALHPELIEFPVNEFGQATTFALSDMPYVELGFGLNNIFKIVELYFIQRMTYKDHPDVPSLFGQKGLGMRIGFHLEF